MNGPQDLGGQMGFGPVAPEADEPLFHAAWEKRALGITIACGAMGAWSIDESRFTRESLHPLDYYGSSYYEIWTKAIERLLLRHGFVDRDELSTGQKLRDGARPKRVLKADDVAAALARGTPADRTVSHAPRFVAGDKVRTRLIHPEGHTRLPRYARGRAGRIEAARGAFVFPDTHAHGAGEAPDHLYTVVFSAADIWGEGADPTLEVSVDAWESYLDPA